MEQGNSFFFVLLQSKSLDVQAIFFFTHKMFIDWQFEAFCTKYVKTFKSSFLELYGSVFVLSFWHFSVWISCYSDNMEQ